MAARLHRLQSRPDRQRAEQAASLRQALLPFAGEMPDAVRGWVAHIGRETSARHEWTFVMLSPAQNHAVVDWLEANSRRPMKAMRLWSLLFTALDRDTGEVLLAREQMAGMIGDTPDNVSAVMGELVGINAVIRKRERVDGMRGPGRVRYFLNPVVGTHLPKEARDRAQGEAPPGPLLRIMQGGKAPA